LKKDLENEEEKSPPIWRIDGKSLLQKFQAFEKDGKVLYRNVSTYSGWTNQNKALFQGVETSFVFQSRFDIVVEMRGVKESPLLPAEANPSQEDKDPEWTPVEFKPDETKIPEDLLNKMETFEVYLQALISQVLDSNFMIEIYAEDDEYFVPKVAEMDVLAKERELRLLELVKWDEDFMFSINLFPTVNVMSSFNVAKKCQACGVGTIKKLFMLYGKPYNSETLEIKNSVQLNGLAKNFELCERCCYLAQHYVKLRHMKYSLYVLCQDPVRNLRQKDPKKDNTDILKHLVHADEWIQMLFRSCCITWLKADKIYDHETNR